MADQEDWRVKAEVASEEGGHQLAARVRELDVIRDAEHLLGHRVVMTYDGPLVFAYASTRAGAEAAQKTLSALLQRNGLQAKLSLTRWHPIEERWEDADSPIPQDAASIADERERLRATEREESQARGTPEWEVRVELPSHKAAVSFANQLAQEDIPCLRRWRFLLIGALSEADAQDLADRIKRETPHGARVLTEGTAAVAYQQLRGAADKAALTFLRSHMP